MKISEAASIARLLGVPADEVMQHAGVRTASSGEQVPVIGWLDGSGEIHLEPGDPVPAPCPNGPMNALHCRTAGSDLGHMDGWTLFVPDVQHGIQPEAVGRLSICRLRDGVIYLAAPKTSRQRGRWDLTGPATSANGVELEWAAPVLLIQP